MKTIILLGAPGAGKGTVAQAVCGQTGFRHVSTGDMLREAVRDETPAGLEAKAYMERGALVPDDLILKLVGERMKAEGDEGRLLFDGFPRTEVQARNLDELLAASGWKVNGVVLLEASDEVLIDRLAGRRVCRACGAVFHVHNIPPKEEGVCDRCGGELYQRADDNEDTVRNRLVVYRRQTEELIDYYEQRGLLHRVDGAQQREAIVAAVETWMR